MQTKSRRTHTDTKYGYRYKIHIHNRHCAVLAAICMACTLSHECLFMSSYASLRLLRGSASSSDESSTQTFFAALRVAGRSVGTDRLKIAQHGNPWVGRLDTQIILSTSHRQGKAIGKADLGRGVRARARARARNAIFLDPLGQCDRASYPPPVQVSGYPPPPYQILPPPLCK